VARAACHPEERSAPGLLDGRPKVGFDSMSETLLKTAPSPVTTPAAPAHLESSPVSSYEVIIGPRRGWSGADLKEIAQYRDLLWLLTWRTVRVRYAQSAVGLGWAVIQPLFQMAMFTLIFGRLAQMKSDGVPYAAFSLIALVPWTYFANALQGASNSLVANASMISKVYFPRIVLPMTEVGAKLFDFGIALLMATVVLLGMGITPNWGVLMVPYLVVLMMVSALGLGLWLATLAVQYRDVNHALGFIIQLMMYANPVIYPTSGVPEFMELPGGFTIYPQAFFALNPMVGVIEGFRSAFLGTRPMPFGWILLGSLTALLMFLTGLRFFRSRERLLADVT
jgi:lipopolysaccharide transport system permease protein